MLDLSLVLVFTFAVNIPFGYWRESVRKFSPAWFVAVHAAVPLVIAVRLLQFLPTTLADEVADPQHAK